MAKSSLIVSKEFREQALSFPEKVDAALATITTVEQASDYLAKAAAMQNYCQQIKASIEIERPIALGVLKLKAKLGQLLERGAPGRGNKNPVPDTWFSSHTAAAYRKLGDHADKLDAYYTKTDDVPTQTEFIRFATGTEKAGTHAHVSLNTGVPEWYTPAEIIEAARLTMGRIDLDPASSKIAQKTVKAKRFFSIDDDGRKQKWSGNVWLNPPYTAVLINEFINKLCSSVVKGDVVQACTLTNNATETAWFQLLLSKCSACCFPLGRVKFLDEEGNPGAPLQGQTIAYIGSDVDAFLENFEGIGQCLRK